VAGTGSSRRGGVIGGLASVAICLSLCRTGVLLSLTLHGTVVSGLLTLHFLIVAALFFGLFSENFGAALFFSTTRCCLFFLTLDLDGHVERFLLVIRASRAEQ